MNAQIARVKTITVTLPDDLYLQAVRRAEQLKTSVDALIASALRQPVSAAPSDFERLERLQEECFAKPVHYRFSARQRLSRDEIHDRRLFR